MTHRILIEPDGTAYIDGKLHDDTGVSVERDMHWTDNLPDHVIPCPERGEWSVKRLGVRG